MTEKASMLLESSTAEKASLRRAHDSRKGFDAKRKLDSRKDFAVNVAEARNKLANNKRNQKSCSYPVCGFSHHAVAPIAQSGEDPNMHLVNVQHHEGECSVQWNTC